MSRDNAAALATVHRCRRCAMLVERGVIGPTAREAGR